MVRTEEREQRCKGRILVVDDECGEETTDGLIVMGYSSIYAKNYNDAVEFLKDNDFDLVIVDRCLSAKEDTKAGRRIIAQSDNAVLVEGDVLSLSPEEIKEIQRRPYSGEDLVNQLYARNPRPKIIYTTAYHNSRVPLGIDQLLMKPFDFEMLQRTVEQILSK